MCLFFDPTCWAITLGRLHKKRSSDDTCNLLDGIYMKQKIAAYRSAWPIRMNGGQLITSKHQTCRFSQSQKHELGTEASIIDIHSHQTAI